ncbi:hypothetical protein H072_1137 [Dactylellina haptotyla CBS 200.50]|uniref:Uncharacterized protein n=1 Tax=Dactylellina haptotyla (strain CBS 200.50) TaxID=1284197 RepID=S8APK9_DACHA|nr:hypothetical protein H072_1137 [Dactylellina haptotyla CBS 200.50]
MDSKAQYRRDSSDNVHVIYPANFNNKAFENYVPPRYTEAGLGTAPIPPPAPGPLPGRKILGMKRKKFWIILILFVLIILGVVIGVGVGVATATKKHNSKPAEFEGAAGPTGTGAPATVTITNTPTTMVTSTVPSATAVPITHCQQMWEGTAPFCDGKCDPGWTVVKQQHVADACDESTETVIIDSTYPILSSPLDIPTTIAACILDVMRILREHPNANLSRVSTVRNAILQFYYIAQGIG